MQATMAYHPPFPRQHRGIQRQEDHDLVECFLLSSYSLFCHCWRPHCSSLSNRLGLERLNKKLDANNFQDIPLKVLLEPL